MPDFEHEEMSVKLFDRAVDVAMQKETTCEVLRNLEAEDFRMVKDMVR